jgi:protein TonB
MYEISEKSEKEQNSKPVPNTPTNGKRSLGTTKRSQLPRSVNFARGMLESSDLKRPRKSLTVLISLLSQSAFVILLILLPLLYTQAFSVPEFEKTMLVVPPPPPPPRNEVRVVPKHKMSLFDKGKLIAPRIVPKHIAILKEAPAESSGASGVAGGVPGGITGGTLGGVLGGILSSANSTVPPPPKPPKSNKLLRVGGQVQAPRLIRKVQPQYPPLAKQTRTQGAVVIDCVVDKQGNVTQVKLVSGHPLLVEAALQAVRQWKYQPTLLNGEPVAVEMIVTVTFTLGD